MRRPAAPSARRSRPPAACPCEEHRRVNGRTTTVVVPFLSCRHRLGRAAARRRPNGPAGRARAAPLRRSRRTAAGPAAHRLPPRHRGPARRRRPLRPRLPRRRSRLRRRLRRRRRLLRHLRLPHHRTAARPPDRPVGLRRPPRPPHPARRRHRPGRHRRRRWRAARPAARHRPRPRPDGLRRTVRQLALRRPADRLPGRRTRPEPAPALLVARRGEPVLPAVGRSAARPRPLPARPPPHRRDHPGHHGHRRGLVAAVRPVDGDLGAARLLLHRQPALGVRGRRVRGAARRRAGRPHAAARDGLVAATARLGGAAAVLASILLYDRNTLPRHRRAGARPRRRRRPARRPRPPRARRHRRRAPP